MAPGVHCVIEVSAIETLNTLHSTANEVTCLRVCPRHKADLTASPNRRATTLQKHGLELTDRLTHNSAKGKQGSPAKQLPHA